MMRLKYKKKRNYELYIKFCKYLLFFSENTVFKIRDNS